jgi:Holliday junction resolvasome RuvABC endonuclease subunit
MRLLKTEKASKKSQNNLRVSNDDKRRYNEIWVALTEELAAYQVHAMVIEVYSPFQGSYQGKAAGMGFSSAWKTAIAFGLATGFAFANQLLLFPLMPMDLKRGILGTKSGSKEQVEKGLSEKVAGFDGMLEGFRKTTKEHPVDALGYAYLGLLELHNLRKMLGVGSEVDL